MLFIRIDELDLLIRPHWSSAVGEKPVRASSDGKPLDTHVDSRYRQPFLRADMLNDHTLIEAFSSSSIQYGTALAEACAMWNVGRVLKRIGFV